MELLNTNINNIIYMVTYTFRFVKLIITKILTLNNYQNMFSQIILQVCISN